MNIKTANLVLGTVCPDNEIILDQGQNPSVMVRIPQMTLAELGISDSNAVHPAFIINGKTVDSIYISKYENRIDENGMGQSIPGVVPTYGITKDEAEAASVSKGAGWHLWTRPERALLELICKKSNVIPKGNNDFGKDFRETAFKGIPGTVGEDGRTNAVLNGSGPLSWTHDGTAAGIWNLKGNCWEWMGGVRLVYGELQVLADNNAADNRNSQSSHSRLWKAVSGSTGAYIDVDGKGTTPDSVKLSWEKDHWQWQTKPVKEPGLHCGAFDEISVDKEIKEKAKLWLQINVFLKQDPISGAYERSVFWANTEEPETAFDCGGRWNGGTQPSIFTFSASHARDYVNNFAGFRTAYVKL